MANKSDDILEEYSSKEYEYGFVTNIEMEIAPKGLSEETIHYISAKSRNLSGSLTGGLRATILS